MRPHGDGYRANVARRALVPFLAIACATGALLLTPGCGDDAATAAATAPAAGEPLTLRDTAPPSAGSCPRCREAAGPQHRCGQTVLCSECGVDAARTGHVHRVSRFCGTCGHEAAINGHVCGETRFDAATLAPVERDDIEDE